MAKQLTALEVLGDRSFTSNNAANKCRAKAETIQQAHNVDMKSYYEGEAAAYNDARVFMNKELRRLCKLFQNGALQIDDFGIHL